MEVSDFLGHTGIRVSSTAQRGLRGVSGNSRALQEVSERFRWFQVIERFSGELQERPREDLEWFKRHSMGFQMYFKAIQDVSKYMRTFQWVSEGALGGFTGIQVSFGEMLEAFQGFIEAL